MIAGPDTLYVHCFGGIGRTGTVVGCWILRHGLATQENVIEVIARLRRADVERARWASPQTGEQVRFVKGWRD